MSIRYIVSLFYEYIYLSQRKKMRFSTNTLGAKYNFQPKSVVSPNHLGNVLTVVSDRKIAVDNNGDNIVDFFLPDIVSATDYGVFGNPLPGRSFNSNAYAYGMNGQMKDDEIFQGAMTAEFWEYDSRLGRRWETDPIIKPWESPYACFYNNPIVFSDYYGLDGDDNKPRPGADSKNKKREGAKSDWENADPKAQGSSGYDGTNDWKSKVDGDKTIVKFTPRSGGVDPAYYSFPSSENTPSDNVGGDAPISNPSDNATGNNTGTTPVTTPTGTTPNPAPTGGGGRPRTTISTTGATTPTRLPLQNVCNPFAGSVTFDWVGHAAYPIDTKAAVTQILRTCNGWLPCNNSAQITIRSNWSRSEGDVMKKQNDWGGRVPYMVMQDRSKWIQGIMINYGKIPSGVFRVPIILFDQTGANGSINFK